MTEVEDKVGAMPAVARLKKEPRSRLSTTEAGIAVRVIIQTLPKHIEVLQKLLIGNPLVVKNISDDVLKQLLHNINDIRMLIYEQISIVDSSAEKPLLMPVPDAKVAIIAILKSQVLTLPNHSKKLGDVLDSRNLAKRSDIDWKKLEDQTVLKNIEAKIIENRDLLYKEKELLPTECMALLKM